MLGRGGQNVNSIGYINRSSKDIRINFSGTEFIDLSFSPYAVTSSGLNHINGNTTIARLKYNNNYLRSSDFTSSSFTVYLKHAARYSTLPPFNLQYPSAATVSNAVVLSGSDFSVNFYSLLDPGSEVRYAFSGCTTTELNGTSLTGTVTAPYGTVTKTFTRANYAIFPTVVSSSSPTISCGAPLPVTTYAVTVSNGVFWLNGVSRSPTMTAGNVYLFDQSNNTNIGNTLVFGSTLDSSSYYTTGVTTSGTAGFTGAYTLLNYTSATLGGLGYYSRQTGGMGYINTVSNLTYTGTHSYSANTNGYTVLTLTGSGILNINSSSMMVYYYVVGGGGLGGTGNSNGSTRSIGGNGANGGVVNTGSFTNYGSYNYTVVVGAGGVAGAGAGGSSSLSGNSTTVTSDGGFVGSDGARSTNGLTTDGFIDQSRQTNGAKGGTGKNSITGDVGENGTISFIPTGIMYGGAGGGGTRAGGSIGAGGTTGGGAGNYAVSPNNGYAGTDYGGGGGGGAGSGGPGGGLGGVGYQGVVFLYWV